MKRRPCGETCGAFFIGGKKQCLIEQGWLDEPLNQAGRDLAALLDRFLSGEGVRARLIADDKIYYPKEFIVDRYKT